MGAWESVLLVDPPTGVGAGGGGNSNPSRSSSSQHHPLRELQRKDYLLSQLRHHATHGANERAGPGRPAELCGHLGPWLRRLFRPAARAGAGTADVDELVQAHALLASFPLLQQLRDYTWAKGWSDVVASLTLASLTLPPGIVYAVVARLSIIRGLATAAFPPLAYCLFGRSVHLSIGPEPLTAVLLGIAIEEELHLSPDVDVDQLASLYALLVGLAMLALSLLRGGFLDQVLSGFLLTGFLTSMALLVLVEQLPAFLGLPTAREGQEMTVLGIITHLAQQATGPALLASRNQWLFGLACLAFLLVLDALKARVARHHPSLHNFPTVLVLILLSIFLARKLDFDSLGIPAFSSFDNAFPLPRVPGPLSVGLLNRAIPSVISIVLVGFLESQSITKTVGMERGYYPSGDGEMLALGTANLLSSFLGAFPAFGSLPRATLLARAGPRTTLVHLFGGLLAFGIVYTFGDLLRFLPKPTIAAIIIQASFGLVEVHDIRFLLRMRRAGDLLMFLATLSVTLFLPISSGIMVCLGLSSLLILRKSLRIDMLLLGRVERAGVPSYVNVKEHPEAQLLEDMLLLSIQGPLLFYNAALLGRTLRSLVTEEWSRRSLPPLVARPLSAIVEVAALTISHDTLLDASRHGHAGTHMEDEVPRATTVAATAALPASAPCHFLLFDLSACTDMDTSSLLLLQKTIVAIQHEGSEVLLSGLRPHHAALLQRSGILEEVRRSKPRSGRQGSSRQKDRSEDKHVDGDEVIFEGLHQAVSYAQAQQAGRA